MCAHLSLLRPLVLALTLATPVLAQGAAPAPQDLEALSYYVSSGDTAAAEAELRRLRAQFPDWDVPSDLSTLGQRSPTAEIDRIYRQIADKKLADARRTMEETSRSFPDWVPPAEMVRLLDTAEAQAAFDAAAASGDAAAAVEIARRSPQILRCDRINNAWRLAEMQARLGQAAAAVQSYRGVIASCTGLHEITATLEKAQAVASVSELADLFRLASGQLPGAGPALKALETRLSRGRGAPEPAAASDLPVAGNPRLPASVAGRAGGGGGSVTAARAAAKRGDWAGCARATAGATSAEALYERAWCVYNLDRPMEALWAFEPAASGKLGGTVTRDARFGKALAFLALNMTEEAARIAADTDLTDQQRVEVEAIILDQRGVRSFRLKEYRRAIAFFDAYEDLTGGLRRDLAMLRAYAWLNLGKRAEARRLFTQLNDQLVTEESRAGLAASR